MRAPLHRRSSAGFTLMEMVISAALMAVILGAAYACLRAGFDTRKLIEPRADAFQGARVALALLSADLRAACPLHKGPEFLGMKRQIGAMNADNLDFATHNYTPHKPNEGDYCSVSWFVEREPKTGETRLWRRRNPAFAFDPLAGGTREEIASDVRGLTFEYYDGYDWYDAWGDPDGQAKQASSNRERPNLTGMPEAVRVTLLVAAETKGRGPSSGGSTNEAPPLNFQTVVRLNLAGASTPASGSGGTTSTPRANGTSAPGGSRQP